MLYFAQTAPGHSTGPKDLVLLSGTGYLQFLGVWVSGCEQCEHLLAVNSCRCRCRCRFAWGSSGGALVSSGEVPIPKFKKMPKIPNILTLLTISLESVPGLVGPPCEQGRSAYWSVMNVS